MPFFIPERYKVMVMVMELKQKIKMLAEFRLFGMTKFRPIGGSYCLILPKRWIEFNATKIDDDYYCSVEVVGNAIVFRPIEPKDIAGVNITEIQNQEKYKASHKGVSENDAKSKTH